MLLFITFSANKFNNCSNFNTSHVIVYRNFFLYIFLSKGISIHLMLLFILEALLSKYEEYVFQYISCYCLSMEKFSGKDFKKEFQYISCYCLSVFHIPLWGYKLYFNTSHVIVYLPEPYPPISKYCSFQYISCYCLSNMIIRCLQHIRYFNTSHVIVYLYRFHSRYPLNLNFNTSHVIVYHSYL